MKTINKYLFLLFGCLWITHCADNTTSDDHHEDPGEHEEETPGEHACEHVQDISLAIDRDARMMFNGQAVDVSGEHRAYQVRLQPSNNQFEGYVDYEIEVDPDEAPLDVFVFRNPDVPLEVQNGNGDIIELEESDEADQCDQLEIANAVELETGSYILHLGPTEHEEVLLVIEASEEHDEHDDH